MGQLPSMCFLLLCSYAELRMILAHVQVMDSERRKVGMQHIYYPRFSSSVGQSTRILSEMSWVRVPPELGSMGLRMVSTEVKADVHSSGRGIDTHQLHHLLCTPFGVLFYFNQTKGNENET